MTTHRIAIAIIADHARGGRPWSDCFAEAQADHDLDDDAIEAILDEHVALFRAAGW
jgi:hypothetical protein